MLRSGFRSRLNAVLAAVTISLGGWSEVVHAQAGQPIPTVKLPPTFTQVGPYGGPLVVKPPRHPAGSGATSLLAATPAAFGNSTHRALGSSPERERPSSVSSALKPQDNEDDDDDDDVPRKPGTISRDHVKIPDATPNLKRARPTLGPHLTPLREFEITDRTSLGVFGQADRIETRFGSQANASRSTTSQAPSVRARDVGAGLTLQFKFGQ